MRSRYVDRAGRQFIRIGSQGRSVDAKFPLDSPDMSRMRGARLRVRGAASASLDVHGNTSRVQLWIAAAGDVAELEAPSAEIPIQTVRSGPLRSPVSRCRIGDCTARFGSGTTASGKG